MDHAYNFVVDLGAIAPSAIHLGVTDGKFSDNQGTYSITLSQLSRVVAIDIRPGNGLNSINPNAGGVIPVAILTTEDFDASAVAPETVQLDGAGARGRGKSGQYGSLEDIDGDGDLDLIVQIENTITWAPDATEARLTGFTWDGFPIAGTDAVKIVPPES